MKIALMLFVVVIIMMCQEADLWRRKEKYKYKDGNKTIKIKVKEGRGWLGKRDTVGGDADSIQERNILYPPVGTSFRWGNRRIWNWGGKREVRDAESDAAYNAAAEDGVFTDEEIQSIFGVEENGLTEFKDTFDVNGDGKIEVKEYEMVKTISSNVNQGE